MIVIGIDPGKTTGFAIWQNGHLLIEQSGQLPRQQFFEWFEKIACTAHVSPLHVVIERFLIGRATVGKEGDAHYAIGGIGIAEYLSEKYEFELTIQGASKAKNFCTDEKLKILGWYHGTSGGHQNDAIRHLVTYLVDIKQLDPRIFL